MTQMTVQEFNTRMGAIIMNLHAFETAVRFFFFQKNKETNAFPKPGAKPRTAMCILVLRPPR